MEHIRIDTHGIGYLEAMEGSDWRWGMDYTGGDLYEAEELYRDGHPIRQSHLVFLRWSEPRVYEPVTAREGQYFGRPCCDGGRVYILLVDFVRREILIYRCAADLLSAEIHASVPLDAVPDCYNLMLHASPLTLTRQGGDNRVQIVWPETGAFAIDPTETLDCRDGGELIFSKWYEDPDYREEVIVRRYPTGEVLERLDGTLMTVPDGRHWLLV